MHFFAEPPLRPDAQAIPDQQHAGQQLGIDGGAAGIDVERSQMLADTGQIHEAINGSQEVILRDVSFYRELVKQCALRLLPWSQHRRSSASLLKVNQPQGRKSTRFFQRITPILTDAEFESNDNFVGNMSGSRSIRPEFFVHVFRTPS
jgi:hypothetical protein